MLEMRGGPLLVAALGLSGCFPGYVRVIVNSSQQANEGRPLQMLARSVQPRSYLGESYQTVAARVVEADASVLAAKVVYPGKTLGVWVKSPAKAAVALYFFYARPGPSWRLLLERPLPLRATIDLDRTGIR